MAVWKRKTLLEPYFKSHYDTEGEGYWYKPLAGISSIGKEGKTLTSSIPNVGLVRLKNSPGADDVDDELVPFDPKAEVVTIISIKENI